MRAAVVAALHAQLAAPQRLPERAVRPSIWRQRLRVVRVIAAPVP